MSSRAAYYRTVGSEVLARGSVAGMVEALDDPYTEYLTPEEYGALQNATARSYSGVGLTVGPSKDGLVVTSALRGPARDAGIRRGDVIVSIDGVPADKVAFERSLFLIKGEEGTNVQLTVKRPAVGKLRFTVVRQELPVPTVRTSAPEPEGEAAGIRAAPVLPREHDARSSSPDGAPRPSGRDGNRAGSPRQPGRAPARGGPVRVALPRPGHRLQHRGRAPGTACVQGERPDAFPRHSPRRSRQPRKRERVRDRGGRPGREQAGHRNRDAHLRQGGRPVPP